MKGHIADDELVLHYYGESPRSSEIEGHLETCAGCASSYRQLVETLRMVEAPGVPERNEHYGLEVWQRLRHQLPDRDPSWGTLFLRRYGFAGMAAAVVLLVAGFYAGRLWPGSPAPGQPRQTIARQAPDGDGGSRRVLMLSVADHLEQSDRVLTEIMNAPDDRDLDAERAWAEDLLFTSRLYREALEVADNQARRDPAVVGIAGVLDELERALLEIAHSPAGATVEEMEMLKRRIDSAALLFKVRVMRDELRRREDQAPAASPGSRVPSPVI
jgi:hypothetical protein